MSDANQILETLGRIVYAVYKYAFIVNKYLIIFIIESWLYSFVYLTIMQCSCKICKKILKLFSKIKFFYKFCYITYNCLLKITFTIHLYYKQKDIRQKIYT